MENKKTNKVQNAALALLLATADCVKIYRQ
jgi:hypothetical protein